MKHLLQIQSEFIKEARKWDELSIDDQKAYLKRHPKSKRRVTAKKLKDSMISAWENKSSGGIVDGHAVAKLRAVADKLLKLKRKSRQDRVSERDAKRVIKKYDWRHNFSDAAIGRLVREINEGKLTKQHVDEGF